jgi:hypothetical protein
METEDLYDSGTFEPSPVELTSPRIKRGDQTNQTIDFEFDPNKELGNVTHNNKYLRGGADVS